MKHRDYKTADAPKSEPLTYSAFADKLAALNKKLADVNDALREGGEQLAAYEKEQTP